MTDGGVDDPVTVSANGVRATYDETESERILAFERDDRAAVVAQNREGYAMLAVRDAVDGTERERYYGLEMALDHAAELLGVAPGDLPLPAAARDMGM